MRADFRNADDVLVVRSLGYPLRAIPADPSARLDMGSFGEPRERPILRPSNLTSLVDLLLSVLFFASILLDSVADSSRTNQSIDRSLVRSCVIFDEGPWALFDMSSR